MTERARLTEALAFAARPREYAVHDAALQGFVPRIRPNGARARVFRMMIPPSRGNARRHCEISDIVSLFGPM